MFGISFSELLLVGLVALVVLGPERLPGAARTAGLWVGRLKRSFNAIKQEVEREIGADDIRRQLHNEHILSMEQEARRILNRLYEHTFARLHTDHTQGAQGRQRLAQRRPADAQLHRQVALRGQGIPGPETLFGDQFADGLQRKFRYGARDRIHGFPDEPGQCAGSCKAIRARRQATPQRGSRALGGARKRCESRAHCSDQ
jgi:sec-independent protein translocase protein TatB